MAFMESLSVNAGPKRFVSEWMPFCIDLDGILIRPDLLVEFVLALLSYRPLSPFSIHRWLLRCKALLKCEIARRVEIDAAHLPYNAEVVTWVSKQLTVRPVVLCTAPDIVQANALADHVGSFDAALASGA